MIEKVKIIQPHSMWHVSRNPSGTMIPRLEHEESTERNNFALSPSLSYLPKNKTLFRQGDPTFLLL